MNRKTHFFFLSALIANAMAGCSWNSTQSESRSQSLAELAQNDAKVVLAGSNGCPAADDGFVGGCLRVAEKRTDANSIMLQIFFEYVGEPKADRETIVVLNGGPGGALTAYTSAPQLRNLAQHYNVIFYDQRGVARSSAITSENVASLDANNYGTPENVEDLSELASRVVKKPIIVLGHSYGAHLGFAFATQHPEQVKAYIALNGSSDNLAMLLQPGRKQELFNSAVGSLNQERMGALVKLINNGQAIDATGNKLSMQDIGLKVSLLISTFKGYNTEVKSYMEAIFAANAQQIDAILSVASLSRSGEESVQKTFRFDVAPNQDINMFVNKGITCQEMFREESFPLLNEKDQAFVKLFRDSACTGIPVAPASRIFDTKPLLHKIESPILIVSGDFDPLVAPETQKRDFALLKDLGKDVTLWTFKNTGHQIFSESPKCTAKVIDEFLARISTAEKPDASENACDEDQEFALDIKP